MGVVWVALSKALDVNVALKLLPDFVAGPESVERMSREARAAARLGHPAIVRVIDFGMTDFAQPFIAMELLAGEELYSLLERQKKLPCSQAVALLLPVIDGLAAAHQAGIVHRDIKPENIFVSRDDFGRIQPKLVDFGIAKLECDQACRLTQSGALLGTPQYLSPEQAFGREDIDFRTDIWSIGVVLYELVTGVQPFSGKNYNALIRSIIEDEPIPIAELGAGDEQLWRIVERCLRKEPKERWESMWAMGQELALWLVQQGVDSDASSRSLRDAWLGAVPGGLARHGERQTAVPAVVRDIDAPRRAPVGAQSGVALPKDAPLERGDHFAAARTTPRRAARRFRMDGLVTAGMIVLLGVLIASWLAMQPTTAELERQPIRPANEVPGHSLSSENHVESMPVPIRTSPPAEERSAAPAVPVLEETRRNRRTRDRPRRTAPRRRMNVDPEFGF